MLHFCSFLHSEPRAAARGVIRAACFAHFSEFLSKAVKIYSDPVTLYVAGREFSDSFFDSIFVQHGIGFWDRTASEGTVATRLTEDLSNIDEGLASDYMWTLHDMLDIVGDITIMLTMTGVDPGSARLAEPAPDGGSGFAFLDLGRSAHHRGTPVSSVGLPFLHTYRGLRPAG